MNPLLGPQRSLDHPRFLPLSDAYSPSLRRLAFLAARHLAIEKKALAEGTYAWVSGPTYETPAEGRFLRYIGADVVGMSTVPEVLAAREEGLNVMVLSLVTNFVTIPDTYRSIADAVDAEVRTSIDSPVLCYAQWFLFSFFLLSSPVRRWIYLKRQWFPMRKFSQLGKRNLA